MRGKKGTFVPLPHPLTSTLLFSPQFLPGPNAKNSFAQPEFCSLRTGTLATQAIGFKLILTNLLYCKSPLLGRKAAVCLLLSSY